MEDLFELLGRDDVDDELRPVLDALRADLERRAELEDEEPFADASELLDAEFLEDTEPGFGFGADPELRVPGSELAALEAAFAHAEQALLESNRAAAAHADAIRRALQIAARHPELYVPEAARTDRDAPELSQRGAATDLSMRLKIPASTLRSRGHEAAVLRERLPGVWRRYADGTASPADVRVAVQAANAFEPGDPRLADLDQALAAVVGTVTQARFRQRVRQVRAALDRASLTERHARAHADRRVVIDHVDDGMAWVSLFVSQLDAAKIDARLDTTARTMHGRTAKGGTQGDATDGARGPADGVADPRTLAQLRADAAVDWLTGAGTATAVRTEVIVTIPLLGVAGSLAQRGTLGCGQAQPGSARHNAAFGSTGNSEMGFAVGDDAGLGSADDGAANPGFAGDAYPWFATEEQLLAHLEGVGPIDPGTAARLFADAPSFLRLVTDPVTGVPLKLGRKRYRPTRKQRLWLALRYEHCTRPACDRLASHSDLDHHIDWHLGGPTDDTNLGPGCRGDHVIRHRTRFTVTRSRRGTITWRSPTGYQASTSPGGRDPADEARRDAAGRDPAEDPEFARPRSPFDDRPPTEYPDHPAF